MVAAPVCATRAAPRPGRFGSGGNTNSAWFVSGGVTGPSITHTARETTRAGFEAAGFATSEETASARHRSRCPPEVTIPVAVISSSRGTSSSTSATVMALTPSLRTYAAPATAATRAKACGNSDAPYIGHNVAPVSGPNRPMDETYFVSAA